MTTLFKITKDDYNAIKEIADNNRTDTTEIIDLFFDYIFDNDIYEDFEEPFFNAVGTIEVETTYSYIDKWSDELNATSATIFEYMTEYLDEFVEEYEL